MQQGAKALRQAGRDRAGKRVPALLVVLTWFACAVAQAGVQFTLPAAEPPLGLREPPRLMAQLNLDRAIEAAERRYRARVVRAEEVTIQGRRFYVLRMLSDEGRVWTVRVDADTGVAR